MTSTSSPEVYTGVPTTSPLVHEQTCEATKALCHQHDDDDDEEAWIVIDLSFDSPETLRESLNNTILGFLMTAVSMGAGIGGNHLILSLLSKPPTLLYSLLLIAWYIFACDALWRLFDRTCQCFLTMKETDKLVTAVKTHCIMWNTVGSLLATVLYLTGGYIWTEHLSWFLPLWICASNLMLVCWYLMPTCQQEGSLEEDDAIHYQRHEQYVKQQEVEQAAEYKLIDTV